MSTRWRIHNRFAIGKRIGHGSFGDIYKGVDLAKGNEEVAIKLENAKTRHPQLQYESRIYAVLSGGTGIPNVRWYGCEKSFNIMVLDLLGPSLEDCFNYCNRQFSLKTVLMIADALISRIEYIHSQNFLHRDIKPDNFLIGANQRERVIYAIDFGLAKRFVSCSRVNDLFVCSTCAACAMIVLHAPQLSVDGRTRTNNPTSVNQNERKQMNERTKETNERTNRKNEQKETNRKKRTSA